MISEMDVGAGLEAALHMEGVGVGVEQIAALLGAGGHHLNLLLKARALLVLCGRGLQTWGLEY